MENLQICKDGVQSITSGYGYRIRPKYKQNLIKESPDFAKDIAEVNVNSEQSRIKFFNKVLTKYPRTLIEDIFQHHSGIDIVTNAKNKDLIAPFDGVISEVFENDLNGKYLKIKCLVGGVDFIFSLCHCKEISVKISDKVKKGDVIAVMGQTGSTVTGVHCHVTVRRKNIVINPLNYFKV